MRSRPPLTQRERRHRYPVRSPELEVDKPEICQAMGFESSIFAYFGVNNVENTYRKAIINYLREKYGN